MRLDDHLERVETYGFERDVFPLSYNGHRLYLLHNDCHETVDNRLSVHFTLYCEYCKSERTLRGRSDAGTNWQPEHLQDAKIGVLGPYVETHCGDDIREI